MDRYVVWNEEVLNPAISRQPEHRRPSTSRGVACRRSRIRETPQIGHAPFLQVGQHHSSALRDSAVITSPVARGAVRILLFSHTEFSCSISDGSKWWHNGHEHKTDL